ncbi:MAG: hypothetical protein MMC33_002533, partial [Icmadophila ericetorum]|nr:hypothetical protein [Icmadophila ericetorum]
MGTSGKPTGNKTAKETDARVAVPRIWPATEKLSAPAPRVSHGVPKPSPKTGKPIVQMSTQQADKAKPLPQVPKERGTSTPPPRTYAAAAKCGEEPVGWTKVAPRKQRSVETKTVVDSKDRKLLFSRIASFPRANEADLMLACNVSLQKAGVSPQTRIAKVRYTEGGKIAVHLTEKAPAKAVVKEYRDLLIRAAKG